MEAIIVKVSSELKRKLQIKCIEEGTNMKEIIVKLLKEYLGD